MLLALWFAYGPPWYGEEPPPVVVSGGATGVPVGWGTAGRNHGIVGQRHDDIKIERRVKNKIDKLRIQEIDNHDIMLFAKTFRQFRK